MRTFDPGPPRAAAWLSGVAVLAALAGTPALAAADTAAAEGAADESAAAEGAADESAAAEYDGGGEAIIVTARRREESSQDVPIALSVVGAQAIERSGSFTLNQVQQLVPSLQVTQTNPRNTNITIRGLGASSAIAAGDGLEYGVGFYVDGVYFGRPGQSQFDLIDLQQIEVLRGPQGTLFGKNTTAGALNISTREPSFDPELTVEGSIGDYHYHQVRATGSLPIVDERVALRVSVADTHRNGFLTNIFDGSDAQDYDNFTTRAQLLIKPGDDIRIRLIGDYSKQTLHSLLNTDDGQFTVFANGTPIANNIFDRAARFGYAIPTDSAFRRTGNSNSPYQANSEGYGASGEIDWNLGPATLTSVTAYRWWDWYPQNDADSTPLAINTKAYQENYQRQFSQELRFASNGTNKIDYVLGLFYYWQKTRGGGETGYGADFAEWNIPPAAAALRATVDEALTGLETRSYSDPRTKSYAAFGQADWHITDALTFTGGLRFTHETKSGSFARFLDTDSGGNRGLLTAAQQAQFQVSDVAPFTARLKDNALSGLATLSYKVAPDVLVYGTYSRGSKSGGLNLTAGGLVRPRPSGKEGTVDPEKVNAFELGFKSQFLDNRLTANAAVFLTEITDYQANVSEQPAGFTTFVQYIANIPKVRSKGIEADVSFAPSKWVTLSAAGSYTDAKYVSFANAPQRPENSYPGAPGFQDLSGTRLPGVSRFAYSLSGDVTQPLSDKLDLYARADWVHRTSFNTTATNSIYGIVPGYGVLNARLGLRTASGVADISIWARNLLDKNYYVTRSPGTFGQITAITADPRTIGATLRLNW